MSDADLKEQAVAYQALIQQQQTMLLSTVNEQGEAESSYAPYIRDEDGVFYIYVSDLASHTQNMLQHGKASVLFIQSENQASNLFARERVTFQCAVKEIQANAEIYPYQLSKMKQCLGETIELLAGLSDFHLLALQPVSGRYIKGFGKAYTVDVTSGQVLHN